MKLVGARIATGALTSTRCNMSIRRGRLHFDTARDSSERLDLSGHLLLPGLINAHDHLEFNLFPRLGTWRYSNAAEWASDIYHPDRSPIREQLGIPKAVRLAWGGLRNLISGVTTVAHHNPWDAEVFTRDFPVRVVRRFGWAHSLDFTADIPELLRATPRGWPFIVHAAEGTDAKAAGEVARLEQLGVLGSHTVLVHATAIGSADIALLQRRRCSIVWCPGSNLGMFGRTLSHDALRSGIPIALGTDSAISFQGDLADELHTASTLGVEAEDLYQMVTSTAASIFRLRNGQGSIREGGVADLVAVADQGQTPAEALLELRPRLVLVAGRVRLVAENRSNHPDIRTPLQPLYVEGRGQFFVDADVAELHRQAQASLGPGYCLAGRRVAA